MILAEKDKYREEINFSESDSDEDAYSEDVYVSEYEQAALRRKEENQQLMKELQIYRVSVCICMRIYACIKMG